MGLRRWYRKRKRAVKLGDCGAASYYWCDPDTGDVWMGGSRWSLTVVVEVDRPVEDVIRMLDVVPMSTLYVDQDWHLYEVLPNRWEDE